MFTLAACNNGGTGAETTATAEAPVARGPVSSKLGETGTTRLMDVVGKYYELKNALVATNAPLADKAAAQLLIAADSLQSFLKQDSTNTNLLTYTDTIVTQSKVITSMMDETCEKKRIAFDIISTSVYALLKQVDIKNAGIYHAYCPMAFNDRGAYWLSAESEIKNPYFGKKMMECGEVTDSF